MKTLFLILLCNNIVFATSKNKKAKVNRIEVKKYSYSVHVIVPFNCSEYDNTFDEMKVMEQSTLDTIIYDKTIKERLQKSLEKYSNFKTGLMSCRGNPQIQITIYYSNKKSAVYLLEDYWNIRNIIGEPVLKDEWSIGFLKSLGGFD